MEAEVGDFNLAKYKYERPRDEPLDAAHNVYQWDDAEEDDDELLHPLPSTKKNKGAFTQAELDSMTCRDACLPVREGPLQG